MSDPWNDPATKRWARRVIDDLVPKMRNTGAVISLVPATETDVKFAVELGFAIMLGKPIIAVVRPGTQVPPKLVLVADEIVELGADGSFDGLPAAIGRVLGDGA